MHNRYMLAVLLVVLLALACGGGNAHLKPSAEARQSGARSLNPTPPDSPEEEGQRVVAYVFADNLHDLPDPASIFPASRETGAGGDALEPEPAFIWHEDGEITRCYHAHGNRASFCHSYQLAHDTTIGAKGETLKKLFRKLFDRLSSPGNRSGKSGKPAAPRPAPPAPTASGSKHLLDSVEVWRRPTLAPDKRIYPFRRTRDSTSPIPNLGLNRAGKTISDGKHTIRFDRDGFPQFNTRFETLLDDIHISSGNRQAHIKAANENLSKTLQKNPGLAKDLGLSADDVAALPKSYQAPTGYRWHHHQDVGRMQLVKFEEHRLATPHTGGMAIWGGGYP